jgi:Ca-activated chloride channel family protein
VNARRLVVFAAVVAVGIAAYGSRDRIGLAQRDANALRIEFGYSPNQEDLVGPLIRRFNTERHRVAGRVVRIDGEAISSGDAEAQIAKRVYRPALWSPASSLWGRLLDY